MEALNSLRAQYPWPAQIPSKALPDPHGWLSLEEGDYLYNASKDFSLIVEMGSWHGKSALNWMRNLSVQLICIDHWKGCAQINSDPALFGLVSVSYNQFLSNCWEFRDRICPIRETTLEGLKIVKTWGLSPDLIYIDAAHDYQSVLDDIFTANSLFPTAHLIGHDYYVMQGVREAVNEFSRLTNRLIHQKYNFWICI